MSRTEKVRAESQPYRVVPAIAWTNSIRPAETWCAAKIHENTAGPTSGPKVCTDRRTVGGTVAMKSSP